MRTVPTDKPTAIKTEQPYDPQAQHIEGDGTNMQLYVRSMGKLLAVTAIFISDDDANNYCERHSDEGVVAQGGGLVFTANLYDRGTHAELPQATDKTRMFTFRPPAASVNHADNLAEALRDIMAEFAESDNDAPHLKVWAKSKQTLAAYEASRQ